MLNFENINDQAKEGQDRLCMYGVTLMRVCATIIVVEKQWVLHSPSKR
jgi:hypothetical protein